MVKLPAGSSIALPMTTLYADALWESPWVFSVFVALEEKRIPYQTQTLDLDRGDQRDPDYVQKTLTARVPTLEHDGFFLSESTAIVEYLEDIFPAPAHSRIFPDDIQDRARARQILGWLRTDLHALRKERPSSTLFFGPASEPMSQAGRADAGKLVRVATELVRSPGATLFDDWSLADAELAFALQRLLMNSEPLPDPLREYVSQQWQRPSVRAFVEKPRPAAAQP
jgi:glutathione S-transferase